MKNEITRVEHVPFMGTDLMAAQDAEGNIWAGVAYICNGIGLNKSQKDTQIQNVQHDEVLKEGCLKFQAGVFDPNNATMALRLDFIPLWLAKINITPAMKAEKPELVETLKQYQLKAKDVLAAAFLPSYVMPDYGSLSPQLQLLINMEVEQKRQAEALAKVNGRLDNICEIVSLDANAWRDRSKKIIVQIADKWGGAAHIQDVHNELYRLLEQTAHVDLKRRVENRRRRMAEEGICKSRRGKLNRLDIIADDPKLMPIYLDLVKRMAIKNNVDMQGLFDEQA